MIDWSLAAVPTYGPWLLAVVTFLSCVAVPIPASVLMLAAGGFAAAGDLVLWQVALASLLGALTGDQAGYWAARWGGGAVLDRAGRGPRAALIDRARAMIDRRGWLAVFLSRWLVSPLGPYANLVTGASRFGWPAFTLAAAFGETVWVALYVGVGYAFGGNLQEATEYAGSLLGFVAAGAVAAGLGWWLLTQAKGGD